MKPKITLVHITYTVNGRGMYITLQRSNGTSRVYNHRSNHVFSLMNLTPKWLSRYYKTFTVLENPND